MTVTITGLTKDRMLAIEAASVVGGAVNGAGHLILERHDGGDIDAGYVIGPQGPPFINGVDTVSNQTIDGAKKFVKPVLFPLGTAALPGIAFDTDPNTGIYGTGVGGVLISTDGVQKAFFYNNGMELNAGGISIPSVPVGNTGFHLNGVVGYNSRLMDILVNNARKLELGSTGQLSVVGSSSLFGGGAFGADMSATQVGQYDADYALLNAYNNVRANVGLILQSKGNSSVMMRVGGDTTKNVIMGNDGILYVNRGALGQSMQITQGTNDMAQGSVRISRVTTAVPQSIVFNAGLGYDFIIGRLAGEDDLKFGVNYGSGFIERMKLTTGGFLITPVGGEMHASVLKTVIPGGEFGQARMLSPSNYGRVELVGNSNGLILSDNAGTTKHLVGSRADVSGNSDDMVFYSYGGAYHFHIGGPEIMRIQNLGFGDVWIYTNPGTGTDSSLVPSFAFVGARRLALGPVDSGGAGWRMVRVVN